MTESIMNGENNSASVEVEDLTFSFGARKVLDGLSFSVFPGEILAVLGANGAGKSTLFHCVLGFSREFGGEITVCGESVRRLTAKALAQKVAFVPQSHAPAFAYSVREMTLMGTTVQLTGLSSPGAEQQAEAEKAMAAVGILELADRDFTRISGGERQLTLVARALAQDAEILIMDEPTANLDYGNQIRVMRRIRELAARGYTVILSTHSPDQAMRFSDRALAISGGAAAALGKPRDVITAELLCKLYSLTPEELEVALN